MGKKSNCEEKKSAESHEVIFKERIVPITKNQRLYYNTMLQRTLTICDGMAGTGKTLLAIDCALRSYHSGIVKKIVLVRPALESGEQLGFTPGSIEEKISPFLEPLFDCLRRLLEPQQLSALRSAKALKLAPLAYMRGLTFDDAFIILDEAQNSTVKQMQLFLTRIGRNSKVVVIGDLNQSDLGPQNGLDMCLNTDISRIDEVGVACLNESDVVRSDIVGKIIKAINASSCNHQTRCTNYRY